MLGGSLLLFLLLFHFFSSPPIRSGEAFSSVIFPLFLFFYLFFGCSDGMEREAYVCDHGLERSDLWAEIIIIINNNNRNTNTGKKQMKRKLFPLPYEAGEWSSSGFRRPGHLHSTPWSCERAKTKLTKSRERTGTKVTREPTDRCSKSERVY